MFDRLFMFYLAARTHPGTNKIIVRFVGAAWRADAIPPTSFKSALKVWNKKGKVFVARDSQRHPRKRQKPYLRTLLIGKTISCASQVCANQGFKNQMVELRFHFNFTSMSLRFHFEFISISLRFHFDVTSMSLRFHFDVCSFTLILLRFHFDFTLISLRSHFECTSISLPFR